MVTSWTSCFLCIWKCHLIVPHSRTINHELHHKVLGSSPWSAILKIRKAPNRWSHIFWFGTCICNKSHLQVIFQWYRPFCKNISTITKILYQEKTEKYIVQNSKHESHKFYCFVHIIFPFSTHFFKVFIVSNCHVISQRCHTFRSTCCMASFSLVQIVYFNCWLICLWCFAISIPDYFHQFDDIFSMLTEWYFEQRNHNEYHDSTNFASMSP